MPYFGRLTLTSFVSKPYFETDGQLSFRRHTYSSLQGSVSKLVNIENLRNCSNEPNPA